MASPMDVTTHQEIFMVAERAVGQAAVDLRAEFGMKFQEITGIIAGVKGELDGELSSLRDEITNAFNNQANTLRAEMSNANEAAQTELVKQIKEFNTEMGSEIGKMLIENNKVAVSYTHLTLPTKRIV